MKLLCFVACFVISLNSVAQGPAALIAHWNMDGSANDVSGNAHNGHANFVTLAPDRFGRPNSAYYFNGNTSIITVPYAADLNLTTYSICTILKVTGFKASECSAFSICRGPNLMPGNYSVQFSDNFYDGGSCAIFDSTLQVFAATAGTTGSGVPGLSMWQYTPHIANNVWYRVVATWNGTLYKIFVNGVLKSTVTNMLGGSIGTSSDSLAIGKNIFNGPSAAYQFWGTIDDVRIYNRVLNDSETVHYGDTCGKVIVQPASSTVANGGNAVFTTSASIASAAYQWQQDIGTGFVNLSTAGIYSGVTTPTLTVTGATTPLNAARYRCLVSNTWVCADTTSAAILTISHVGINSIVTSDMVNVYPNPSHTQVSVQLPVNANGAQLQLINEIGQVVAEQNFAGGFCQVDIALLRTGVYTLKVKGDDFTIYKKILKN